MTRYAIYAVPGLGAGAPADARALRAAVEQWYQHHPEITEHPRRYGFHATLKAPFELAPECTVAELEAAITEFAAQRPPVMLRDVRPTVLGAFRALAPHGDTTAIDALEHEIVPAFEPFRAALRPEDLERRLRASLTARQRELLDEYGYPHVLDEFHVHLTLTDSLKDDGARVDAAIAQHFAAHTGNDVGVTALALFVEPSPGANFTIQSVHPFQSDHPFQEAA